MPETNETPLNEAQLMRDKANTYLWQFGTSIQKNKNKKGPLVFQKADGIYLYDIDGKKYIDGHSGVWVANAGHGQTKIIQAITRQAETLNYALSEEGYANVTAIRLAEKMVAMTKGEMNRVYFTCGGSESVEIALRMARVYHRLNGKPRKVKIISRHGGYHGATLFTLTVSSFDIFSKAIGPNPAGISRVAHPYCFRCPFKKTYPECQVECAQDLEKRILLEGPETVAAFIAEPVSTSSGLAIPPAAYWEKIREICDRYGVLLIADEIVTGAGRTGTFLGMENFSVCPDIITMAKSLTSGYAPLGAVMTHRNFTGKIPDNAFLIPGYTFTGHPLACAAGLANLQLMEEENLFQKAREMGTYLKNQLELAIGDHPFTGDIRHIGLMVCVELVKNRDTKESFEWDAGVSDLLTVFLREKGLYLRLVESYIHIAPPFIIDKQQVDELVEMIKAAFFVLEEKFINAKINAN